MELITKVLNWFDLSILKVSIEAIEDDDIKVNILYYTDIENFGYDMDNLLLFINIQDKINDYTLQYENAKAIIKSDNISFTIDFEM